jgi:23S rRNA (guanosine2251-2'-O)-methyltransferase
LGLGGEQVEGAQAVRELLAARRRPVHDVWLVDDLAPSAAVADIRRLALAAGIPVRPVTRGRLDAEARTDAPQGVLAHAAPLPEAELDVMCRGDGASPPFLLALDGVTDPHNLGALLRTAECAGATGAVLPRHRSAHVTPTVAKAAAGAVEHLPIAVVPGLPSALSLMADAGLWVIGLDADAPSNLFSLALAEEPVALVLGSEGKGLSRLARGRCQLLVSIPRRGAIPSLNVAAAGALACFEVVRRRTARGIGPPSGTD